MAAVKLKSMYLFPFLLLLICISYGASYDEILNDKKKQIEVLQKEIDDIKAQSNTVLAGLSALKYKLDSLNTALDGLSKLLNENQDEHFLTALEIAQETNMVLFLEEEVVRIQESFRNKIVNLYKHGRNYELELLLSSKTPNEYLRRNEYLHRFSQSRKKELRDLKTKKFLLDEKKKLLTLSTSSRRFYIESRRNEYKLTLAKINEVNSRIVTIKNLAGDTDYKIKINEEAINRIQTFTANFSENRKNFKGSKISRLNYPSGNFEEFKGMLNYPVDIAVLKLAFGEVYDNITNTKTMNNGVDFSIAKGSKVFAAGPGMVSITGTMPYYGNVIIINHGNGYFTLYAILDEVLVKKGDVVRANQVIAKSGISPEGQELHFELWKDKFPLDPNNWFRQ